MVFTKSFDSLYVTIVEFIFSVEDKCQVMIAGGRQYDVVQERFICFPTVTTIDEGAKVTDDTGSENIRYRWCTINKKKKKAKNQERAALKNIYLIFLLGSSVNRMEIKNIRYRGFFFLEYKFNYVRNFQSID